MEIRLLNDTDHPGRWGAERPHYIDAAETAAPEMPFDIRLLLRRYWILIAGLVSLGALLGFVSVVLKSPMYRAGLLLEVESVNEALLKNSLDGSSLQANDVNIQTEIAILKSGAFRQRGAERLRTETVPLNPPAGKDIFSRLRERFRPATRDPLLNAKQGLDLAMGTFDARPMAKTRLIELSCESSGPDVAAQFLNSMAAEFMEDASREHSQTAQKTTEWLTGQMEETKSNLQDAEDRLRRFVQASGNLFAGQEGTTLADVELAQAKSKLADIRSQRIAAQARYEFSLNHPSESMTEVQSDTVVHGYQQQISQLMEQRAALLVTFTPKNEKVQRIDAELAQLHNALEQQIAADVKKIRDDYEAAVKEEQQRADYWASKSQKVSAEASKASEYTELKRQVETYRQNYQALQMQLSQAGLSNSAPMKHIRIVEASTPPAAPYEPMPVLNISLGTMLGMALAGAVVFLKERTDHSIRAPGITRSHLSVPELGVIPKLDTDTPRPVLPAAGETELEAAGLQRGIAAWTNWKIAPPFVTESFRGVLASILRAQPNGWAHSALLVTSPGPGEGKTTVVQNLGIALAETGRKIILVDGDFRRPHLHKRFRVPNEWGLIDLLTEAQRRDSDAGALGLSTAIPGLYIMPNRSTDNHVARALYSPRLRAVFQKLRENYDLVLVDAPPFLHLADARIVAPITDAAVLVLRSGVTTKATATETIRRMREDGLHLLGTVLTAWDASSSYLRQHYYYYDYAHDDPRG